MLTHGTEDIYARPGRFGKGAGMRSAALIATLSMRISHTVGSSASICRKNRSAIEGFLVQA